MKGFDFGLFSIPLLIFWLISCLLSGEKAAFVAAIFAPTSA